jgi:hypothetical protein
MVPMTTEQQSLTRRTYDAFMYARTTRDADGARAKLRALREETEAAGMVWDAIRTRALLYDVKVNG